MHFKIVTMAKFGYIIGEKRPLYFKTTTLTYIKIYSVLITRTLGFIIKCEFHALNIFTENTSGQ